MLLSGLTALDVKSKNDSVSIAKISASDVPRYHDASSFT